MAKVNLKELAEQIDFQMDEWSHFVDKRTGEVVSVMDEHLGYAEEPEEAPGRLADWEKDEIRRAAELLDRWDDLLPLPDKRRLDEYGMMEDFIRTVPDVHIRDCLSVAIEGKGAFRRFKDTAIRFGVVDEWYRFKERALLSFARAWCEENELSYEPEEDPS